MGAAARERRQGCSPSALMKLADRAGRRLRRLRKGRAVPLRRHLRGGYGTPFGPVLETGIRRKPKPRVSSVGEPASDAFSLVAAFGPACPGLGWRAINFVSVTLSSSFRRSRSPALRRRPGPNGRWTAVCGVSFFRGPIRDRYGSGPSCCAGRLLCQHAPERDRLPQMDGVRGTDV